jgi:AcrR family transcriptional regulator
MGQPERSDTRQRIQAVALDLFTEQGYETTSLREIAERLGVTKAALYYHFKSKEEIVQSLISERVTVLEDLVEWAKEQPRTAGTRREFVRRYAIELHRGHYHMKVMRFFERNPTLAKVEGVDRMRARTTEIMDLLSAVDATPQQRLKGSLALVAIHVATFALRDADLTDEERRDVALDVALELLN